MNMLNYLARKNLYSKRTLGVMISLAIFAVILTFLRLISVEDTISSYASVFSRYTPDHALFLWLGHIHNILANRSSVLNTIGVTVSTVFPTIVLPLMLILFGTDQYYNDRRAGMIQIICTKGQQSNYILAQATYCFVTTFLIVVDFLIMQLFVTLIINRMIIFNILPVVKGMPYTFSEIISALGRLGLYYASLSVITYSVSLFIRRAYVIILLMPVLLSMGSTSIMLRLFLNDPLRLSFIYSGLSHANRNYYWLFITVLLAITAMVIWLKLLIVDKHENID